MAKVTPEQVDLILRRPKVIGAAAAVLLIAPIPLLGLAWLLFSTPIKAILADQFWLSILVLAGMLFIIIHACAACILAERKFAAYCQDRMGPNRVGWWGVLQPIADGIKFLLKEDFNPRNVDRPLFLAAPAIAFTVALLGFAVIPWGGYVVWPWMPAGSKPLVVQAANVDIGFLYMLAVASLSVYGVVLAGYASNNKYAFYGGMRATAQMLSYEVPLGLALLVVLLLTGTLRLDAIVNQQAQSGIWNVFLHPVAFFLVLVAAFAETNRAPFDLAECEQELVAGYHTEYSSMKFALFFLGEYAHMITNSALMVALFFGGWAPLPFVSWYSGDPAGAPDPTWWNVGWLPMLIKVGVFLGKVTAMIGFYMLIRWTLPRFRFDQLMKYAWKSLVPVGMVLVIAQAFLLAYGWRIDAPRGLGGGNLRMLGICLAVNVAVLVIALAFAALSRAPVTGRQDNLPPVEMRPAS